MRPEQLPEFFCFGTFGMPGTSLVSRNNYQYYIEFEIDLDNHLAFLTVLDSSNEETDEIVCRIPLSEQFLNNFFNALVEGGLISLDN